VSDRGVPMSGGESRAEQPEQPGWAQQGAPHGLGSHDMPMCVARQHSGCAGRRPACL